MNRLFQFILIIYATLVPSWAGDPPLINIKEAAPHILVEIRYATTNNFTGQKLYPVAECLLNEPAAFRLARVQKSLEKKGLGLKVWDCYRPVHIQKKLWEVVPDPRYVANPIQGSRHNRGASVDLTLVDNKGRELPMPTTYDHFGPEAHRDFKKTSKEKIRNRNILEKAMVAEGFIPLPTEWWHFDDPEWQNYTLRDEPLGEPALLTDKKNTVTNFALPENIKQLVVVQNASWTAASGNLSRYEKTGGKWKKTGKDWPVSLGKKGMAWGLGLHVSTTDGPHKRESDLAAAAGVFKIGRSYGYEKDPPSGTTWPYQTVTHAWRCIDDPASRFYNRVKEVGLKEKKDWKSAEEMRRKDHLYKWVINIEQNFPETSPGGGSCIFFHVWRTPGSPTRGCTAMAEENIMTLLNWLDPSARPHLVALPKPVYTKLKKSWKLP